MASDPGTLWLSLDWWHRIVLVIVAAGLLAGLVHAVGGAIMRRRTGSGGTAIGTILLEEVRVLATRTILLLGIYHGSELLPNARLTFYVSALALTALVVQWGWSISRIGRRTTHRVAPGGRHADFAPIVRNLWTMSTVVIGLFVVLAIWNVDVTPLLASAGIIGIIVAVAAQGTIGNVFAGIALSFDHSYRVGDVLTLASGERGRVSDISLRSTTLVTRDQVTITVPNTNLNEQQIINESAPERPRRVSVPVGVAYGSDLDRVERLLRTAATSVDYVLDDPRPAIRYRSFGDSAVELDLLCYIRNPNLRGRAIDDIIRSSDRALREAGITIPFPQRQVSYLDAEDRADSHIAEPELDDH